MSFKDFWKSYSYLSQERSMIHYIIYTVYSIHIICEGFFHLQNTWICWSSFLYHLNLYSSADIVLLPLDLFQPCLVATQMCHLPAHDLYLGSVASGLVVADRCISKVPPGDVQTLSIV